MTSKRITILAALLGLLAVGLGAFGAHALKDLLVLYNRQDTYELAVRYHFYHALALLFAGMRREGNHTLSASLFLGGITLFSGSLYFLALTNSTALVLITPLGGLLLLGGWAALAWEAYKK